MDANKMGAFIAGIRKEKGMTQAELADTLSISRSSGAVLRSLGAATVFVSAIVAAMSFTLLLQNGTALLFPEVSLIMGLAAWMIPVWRMTRGSARGASVSVLVSMGLAGAAVCMQLFDICQNMMVGDWAAVDDTIYALCLVVLAFMAISVLLNTLMLLLSKVKR